MGRDFAGKKLPQGISQRKDGRYCGRYTDRYGKRRCVYGDKVNEVNKRLLKAKADDMCLRGTYDDITLDKWYEIWVATYTSDLSYSTSKSYEIYYRRHVRDRIGWKKLKDIRPIDIKGLFTDLSGELSYSTISCIKGFLSGMFRDAEENEYVIRNPVLKTKLPNARRGKTLRALTIEEQELILRECENNPFGNFVKAQLSSGLRCGELGALKKSDIDFEKGIISVSKTLCYRGKSEYRLDSPKTTTSTRRVPMTEMFRIAVRNEMSQNKKLSDKAKGEKLNGLIFLSQNGMPIIPTVCNNGIRDMVDSINARGGNIQPFSTHCLRHTFCTRLIEHDVNPKAVQAIMGHANFRTTMEKYAHVNEDFLQSVSGELKGLF